MRIYLNNCCFGRPFDDQDSIFENMQCRLKMKRESVGEFLKLYSAIYIDITFAERVQAEAEKFISAGIKQKDAYHVASAILADCDYFLSVDDRLIKHNIDGIIMMNPIEFLKILEDN